jgi:hypothetical protein
MFLNPERFTISVFYKREVGCLSVENDKLLANLALEGACLSPEELVPARECAGRLRDGTCNNFNQATSI